MIWLPFLEDLTYREWHALVNGFYKGLVEGGRHHEYEKEKHYWRTGYMGGFLVRFGMYYVAITTLAT